MELCKEELHTFVDILQEIWRFSGKCADNLVWTFLAFSITRVLNRGGCIHTAGNITECAFG